MPTTEQDTEKGTVRISGTISQEVDEKLLKFESETSLRRTSAVAFAISEYLRLRDLINDGKLVPVAISHE